MLEAQRPVLHRSVANVGAHIDLWPDPGTIYTDPDVYIEVSTLLEGEQQLILPSADSEQAVALQVFSFSSFPLALPPPETLERDLKPNEGAEPERHDVAQHPAP